MGITRNGFVRFLSALMSAIFVFTFLPFNAVTILAEGEEKKGKGLDEDDCFTVVVTEKIGQTHDLGGVLNSTQPNGDPIKNIIQVYSNPVAGATVKLISLEDETFSLEGITDSDGKAKFKLADEYYIPRINDNGDWPYVDRFKVEVTKADTGYKVYEDEIRPNFQKYDGAYYYYSAPLELTNLPQDLDDIAGISDERSTIDYDGSEHKASEFFTLKNGLKVSFTGDEPGFTAAADDYSFTASFYGEGYTDGDNSDADEIYERTINVTIKKIKRTLFSFPEPKSAEINYAEDNKSYKLPALQYNDAEEPGEISYAFKKNPGNIATVSETGVVNFNKTGSVTVTATMAESTNYLSSTDDFSITAKKSVDISFKEKTVDCDFLTGGISHTQTATCVVDGEDNPAVIYSLVDDLTTAEAKIDSNTGKVDISSAGVVVVKAYHPGNDCYPNEARYTINVGLAERTIDIATDEDFVFGEKIPIFTDDNPETLNVEYVSGEGAVKIVKEEGIYYLEVKSGNNVSFEINVSADEDNKYKAFEGTITGKTSKAEWDIDFKLERYDQTTAYNMGDGGNGEIYLAFEGYYPKGVDGNYDFSSESDPRVIAVRIQDIPNGSIGVTLNKSMTKAGTVNVVIILKADDDHNEKTIKAAMDFGYNTSIGTEVNYNGKDLKTDYYTEPVVVSPREAAAIDDTDGKPVPSYPLDKDGIYPAREEVLFYNDEGQTNIGTVGEIKIDMTKPTISVDVTDPATTEVPIFNILLNEGVVGVYAKNTLTVNVTATDNLSGVDTIKYALGDSKSEFDAVEVEYAKSTSVLTNANGDKTRTGSFKIPVNSKERIQVWAYDIAGNKVYTYDNDGYHNSDKITVNGNPITILNNGETEPSVISSNQAVEIITDSIAPNVTVDFNDEEINVDYAPYFNSGRTATITIEETNYFKEDVELIVTKDGKTINMNDLNYRFEGSDFKTIKVYFTENGSYTFYVKYVDRSGNESVPQYKGIAPNSFKIDTNDPVVTVTYDDNSDDVKHKGEYFSTGRTATINIDELNYSSEGLTVNVKIRRNLNDKFADAELSTDYVLHPDTTGSKTATVDFISDGDYEVEIYYTDLAGNSAKPTYFSDFAEEFTIDTTDPVVSVVYTDSGVHNEKYFNSDRTATITIKERNFDKDNANYSVNGNYFIPEWKTDSATPDVHTFIVPFTEENEYKIAVHCTDKADNTCLNVDYGKIAPQEFVIDKSAPTNLMITINGESVVAADEKAVVSNSITFDKFYNEPVTLFVGADCSISGLDVLQYQLAEKSTNYRFTDEWLDYDDSTGITVNPGTQFVLYFRATDKASNSATINSTGIIIDSKEPEGEKNAPEIDIIPSAPNSNGFYNGDVSVKLTAADPAYIGDSRDAEGSYSGLKRINYRIYTTDTDAEETGTLLNLVIDKDNPKIVGKDDAYVIRDNLAYSWTKSITINSEKFNSNNVIVEVIAEDNAGNVRITKTSPGLIKIDVTKPTVNISYNNNNADADNCFKEDRVATITITERNFDPKGVNITLNSSTGAKPEINGWTKSAGSGNGDNTKWKTTIPYTKDADYTFDIAFTDLANNVATSIDFGNSVAPKAFTIDKTLPTINVSYDNNDVANGIYYKKARTATITVVERNFDAGRVNITLRATDDGATINVPAVSNWSNNGETHTATIVYDKDGRYVFDISVKDKAGNDAADFAEQTFFVDTKVPELKITGVKDKSANNGDLEPVITYSDTNYSEKFVTVKFSGASRGKLDPDGTYTDIKNGRTFKFNNFAKQKEIDDIYTLEVTVVDLAGNKSTQLLTFSINRFGSTYELDEAAKTINGTYVSKPVDIVISEVNPNQLVESVVTIFKNNESITLVEGVDYDVQMTGGNGEWCGYKYTIHSDVFADDGVYKVSVYSRDEAGNISENTLDTKNTSLQFGIDATSPNIVAANLSGNTTYAEESHKVSLIVTDNLLLSGVDVYLDDYNTPYVSWTAEQVAEILTGNGSFTFDITDYSNSAHKVKIVGTDAAGNVSELEITNFYVTTNLFVRYYTNTPLVIGSIVGLFLIVALAVVIVVVKRRKYSKR